MRHTFVSQESDLVRFFHFFESFDDIIWRKGVNIGFENYIESLKKTPQKLHDYDDFLHGFKNITVDTKDNQINEIYSLYQSLENKINSDIKIEYHNHYNKPSSNDYLTSKDAFYFKILKIKNLKSCIDRNYSYEYYNNWNNRNKILIKMSQNLIFHNFSKSFSTAYLNLKEGYYNPQLAHYEYLICLLLSIVFFIQFLRKRNYLLLFSIIFIVIHIANLTLISFTALMIGRYVFYTKYVLITILIAFLISVICQLKCFAVFKESDKWKQAPPQQ